MGCNGGGFISVKEGSETDQMIQEFWQNFFPEPESVADVNPGEVNIEVEGQPTALAAGQYEGEQGFFVKTGDSIYFGTLDSQSLQLVTDVTSYGWDGSATFTHAGRFAYAEQTSYAFDNSASNQVVTLIDDAGDTRRLNLAGASFTNPEGIVEFDGVTYVLNANREHEDESAIAVFNSEGSESLTDFINLDGLENASDMTLYTSGDKTYLLVSDPANVVNDENAVDSDVNAPGQVVLVDLDTYEIAGRYEVDKGLGMTVFVDPATSEIVLSGTTESGNSLGYLVLDADLNEVSFHSESVPEQIASSEQYGDFYANGAVMVNGVVFSSTMNSDMISPVVFDSRSGDVLQIGTLDATYGSEQVPVYGGVCMILNNTHSNTHDDGQVVSYSTIRCSTVE